MVITKYYTTRKDGVDLFLTKSDKGLKIRKVGTDEVYDDAIDVAGAPFKYEETDQPIESEEEPAAEEVTG